MNKTSFAKRRYVDIRHALIMFSPVLAYSNFILIAYNFTDLKDMLPFLIFAPVFTIGLIIILTIVGKVFRTKQQATDITLTFERSIEANKTLRITTELLIELGKKLDIKPSQEILDRVEYLKRIERQEV